MPKSEVQRRPTTDQFSVATIRTGLSSMIDTQTGRRSVEDSAVPHTKGLDREIAGGSIDKPNDMQRGTIRALLRCQPSETAGMRAGSCWWTRTGALMEAAGIA